MLGITCLALVGACFASLLWGSSTIPVGTVVDLLLHPDDSPESFVINESRITRTWLGLLVGSSLGAAGAVMQAVTRNPLAEPGLLGVNSGAALAIVLGSGIFGIAGPREQILLALVGACLASILVYAVGSVGGGGASPIRLLLAGAAFSAASGGVISVILMVNPPAFQSFRFWDIGALTRTDMPPLIVLTPMIIGFILVLFLNKGLSNIALGDDIAVTLGTNLLVVRTVSLIALTLLCAAATAAAGPIGFVGLMVPLFATWCMGPHRGWIILCSAVMGATLVLSADVLGRLIARPGELQVGLLTAFVGAPALLWMLQRMRRDRL